MTRKRRRLLLVGAGMLLLGGAAALVLTAARQTLVFFYSPSELQTAEVPAGRAFRLGGLVEENSLTRDADGLTVHFRVTDLQHAVPVTYRGLLPDLFREGQGVVTLGTLGPDGTFVASEVLAKHDENYMPKEVAEALKKSGRWQEGAGP
jgi:cytochrome c-type biogenesis protein CcmE